jgi:hypothetical protein
MDKIIKKIHLKKNAYVILTKAFERGWISKSEIKDMIRVHLWLEKGKDNLILCTIKLENALRQEGIIIINQEIKRQKSEFSITDFSIFKSFPVEDLDTLVSLFNSSIEKELGTIMHAQNNIIFLAYGAITIDLIDEKGRERMLQFMGEDDIFIIDDDFHATIRSEYAYLWQFPREKLNKLSPIIKNFILYHLKNQVENLRRYKIATITDSKDRIKQYCELLDDKYPIKIDLTDETIANAICFTRETVTRKK